MKDLPYKITTKKLEYGAEKWCIANFGERWFPIGRKSGNWSCMWAGKEDRKHYHWYFRYEKDALFFSLRWL